MKTYRADSGIDHRLSIYGERSMPQDSAGKAAVRHSGRGVLKRLAAAEPCRTRHLQGLQKHVENLMARCQHLSPGGDIEPG